MPEVSYTIPIVKQQTTANNGTTDETDVLNIRLNRLNAVPLTVKDLIFEKQSDYTCVKKY